MSDVRPWPPVETELPVPHPDAPAEGSTIPMHYSECFGCGDKQEHGLHIQSMVGAGHKVLSEFTVTQAHQGAAGLAHGGLLAAAFDEALGAMVGNLMRQPAVTGKLETDFRRPVPVGSTLYITAQLDGLSGRKIYVSADGRLDASTGPVAVNARGLFITVGFEHFTKHGESESRQRARAEVSSSSPRQQWDINP